MGAAASVCLPVLGAIAAGISALVMGLTGTPRQHNNTHDAIRQHEEWERQQREERERLERQHREQEQRLREEMQRREREERERAERQRREEQQRHEEEMRRMQEEERERAEQQQREAQRRHEEEQRRLQEEAEARLAEQRREAEELLRRQQEEAQREKEEMEKKQALLEQQYLAGIQPEVWPTPEERKKAELQLLEPRELLFHCAIAGLAGSGKSSLINAFRGLKNHMPGPNTAPTGVTETTMQITAYRDPSPDAPRNRFVWYDVPGAGTISIPGWQYFNQQGLFVFDLIIVVVDNRFSEQDLIILKHCERYKIPSFIVRSKANQHIENTMRGQYGWEDSDDERDFREVCDKARDIVVTKTRASVRENLRQGGLDPAKKVYIVSCDALGSLVRDEARKLNGRNKLIDEPELMYRCLEAVKERRF